MKTRVESQVWRDIGSGESSRRWHVFFEDGCGCEEEQFKSFRVAIRFAYHLAMGGSRWEFVA